MGESLAWLDRHVNLEAIEAGRAGRFALPSLERIAAFADAMGDPQSSYPVVHVTGTNGKGSTARMCASLLGSEGLRIGLYASPHLESPNERISVAGREISDEELAASLSALAELEVFLGVKATWFELMTAAAYRYFADEAVDAAVVEVGLGGRYDATNIAEASVAVVTNVELDHTEILGPTRAAIASEKAGIIKGSSALVLGETDPDIAAIFEGEATGLGVSTIWTRGDDFGAEDDRLAVGGRSADLYTPLGRYEDVHLPLYGGHQSDNAATAVAAAQAFVGSPLADDVVREGFAAVRVPGRMEVVRRRPLVVLDGAHNAAGARAAGATLADDFSTVARIVVVVGCLNGRDPGEILDGLLGSDLSPGAGGRLAAVVGCSPPSPRAQPAEAVTEAASARGIDTVKASSVLDALDAAVGLAGDADLVLVTGSLYLVGAARSALARSR